MPVAEELRAYLGARPIAPFRMATWCMSIRENANAYIRIYLRDTANPTE